MTSGKTFSALLVLLAVLSMGFFVMVELWPKSATSSEAFVFDGLRRTYYIHVPLSYDNATAVPLVIVLHGYTGNGREIGNLTGFSVKADEEGFIVVYPEGLSQRWNVGFGTLKFDTDDVGFINELINRLEQKYVIDPKKIYVTGFSNGAMMAYLLGAELSEKIAAIAPVAGSIGSMVNGFEQIPEPSHPVSVIVFHGTADTSVSYEGDEWFSVAESVAFWVNYDVCSINSDFETISNGSVTVSVYTGGANGTEVVLYTLIGLGHSWPRQAIGVIEATDIIWDFFKSHPKQ